MRRLDSAVEADAGLHGGFTSFTPGSAAPRQGSSRGASRVASFGGAGVHSWTSCGGLTTGKGGGS